MKLELLENNFYTIKGTSQDSTNITFVDFQYNPIAGPVGSNTFTTLSPNIFQKTIKVQPLTLLKKDLTIENIKNEINKDFFKVITGLANHHREFFTQGSKKFNIDVKDLKKRGIDVSRGIIAKFNNASNLIAVEGRIGPSQYLVSNGETYDYILKYIGHNQFLFNTNGMMMIGNMPYIIDNSIEDDNILFGRKNSIDQPGVHCLILTDDKGDILLDETADPEFINNKITIYYKIVDLGFHPYHHFYSIKTRNIAYYRNLKLQRIKEIYGN